MNPLVLLLTLVAGNVETFDGSTTAGWALNDLKGSIPAGATLATVDGALVVRYERGTLSPAFHAVLLTDLREIRLKVRSQAAGTFALGLEDGDRATFHFFFPLKAGEWTDVSAAPVDFQLNADSPIRKTALDAARLGLGYAMFDLGALTGAKGANTIEIDQVEIETAPLDTISDDLEVEGSMEISKSCAREGNIVVRKEARLRITATRFALLGDITIEDGGVLEIVGGLFHLPQRFNHERRIHAQGRARISFRDAFVVTLLPATLDLTEEGTLDMDSVRCMGGFTVTLSPRSRVTLRKAITPGEFVIAPESEMELAECAGVMLWFTLGASEAEQRLSLPTGVAVPEWKSPAPHRVRVRSSVHLLWGLLSTPGCNAVIEDSDVLATGIAFSGGTPTVCRDLHNKRATGDYALDVSDRKLRLVRSKVGAWNFYPVEKSRLNIDQCTFGEILTFQDGRAEANDSTCDGTGGYVGASGTSELRLTRCKITCLVVARERSTIVLDDCDVTGDIRATGKSTVRLIRCRTSGRVECEPGAKLERE